MNAELVLPLERMTVAEKMDVIDRIMDDLSRNSSAVPVIEWHGEMLKQRAENIKNGTDTFLTLEEAEARIHENRAQMNIVITESASDDIAEGYLFYEQQYQGLGDYFETSIFADLRSLVI